MSGIIGRLIHAVIVLLGAWAGVYVGFISALFGGKGNEFVMCITGFTGFALTVWAAHLVGKWVSQGTRSSN